MGNKCKGPGGPPQKIIDWEKVDQLLIAGCKGTEIAAHLGIHSDTLYLRCDKEKGVSFSTYLQEKRAVGNTLLRAAQFDEAVRKRDRGMLVWLGKNRLEQSDKEEVRHKGNIPVEVVNFADKDIQTWSE